MKLALQKFLIHERTFFRKGGFIKRELDQLLELFFREKSNA